MYRENPYSFDAYLHARDSFNDYSDNPFVQQLLQHFTGDSWQALHEKMKAFSEKPSFRWRSMSESIAHPDRHPTLQHYDAYNHRIDRILRPETSLTLEKEMFSEGLFSRKTSGWEQMIKRFLMHHNGEAGVMCPIACTDGLVALLRNYESSLSKPLQEILTHCTEGIEGDYGIGAQYMTEIQGGSNIPANLLRAVPAEDGSYRLYGNKFFCSAVHADYSVVTARIEGSEQIGAFVVPSWMPGDKSVERRNETTINRLKRKLGTCELPTAEIDYHGAVAHPVGPLDKGVAIAVGIVLTRSRLDIGLASSAFMMRTAREALMYGAFREVFGRKINQFPMAKGQLKALEQMAKRTTAGAFKVYGEFLQLQQVQSSDREEWKKRQFELRELILLQKVTTAKEAAEGVRLGLSMFGGHGVIEDFSSLPRLLRDAMVNELWEGPKNVLLAQIHRDLQRASAWYPPREFVARILKHRPDSEVEKLTKELEACLSSPLTDETPWEEEKIRQARIWENLCEELFIAYQYQALSEVPDAPLLRPELLQSLQSEHTL